MLFALIGSRDIPEADAYKLIGDLVCPGASGFCTELITGGAHGVDQATIKWCLDHKFDFRVIYPDYDRHGKRAPLIRDVQIAEQAERAYAIWDGKSRGTRYTINQFKMRDKLIFIHRYDLHGTEVKHNGAYTHKQNR